MSALRLSPRGCAASASALLLAWLPLGCEPVTDTVFERRVVQFRSASSTESEARDQVAIELELDAPSQAPVVVGLQVVGGTASAHGDCNARDYSVSLEVRFEPGETRTSLLLQHLDDDIAEVDETALLELTSARGASLGATRLHSHVLLDDDRGSLLDVVRDFGATGDGQTDATEAIEAAVARAEESAEAVIYFPPGDYLVQPLALSTAANYVGPGARLLQAPAQATDAQLLVLDHGEPSVSRSVLVQGLTFSGQRELQGPFEGWEFQESALFSAASSDPTGTLRLVVSEVRVEDTGGSGIVLGPGTDSTICQLTGHEVFTDFLKLAGGEADLLVRGAVGDGTVGTTGISLTSDGPAARERKTVTATLSDVTLRDGDLELDVFDGSRVLLERLSVDRPPFTLKNRDSQLEVVDSTLAMGPAPHRYSRIVAPGQMTFRNVHFVLDERTDPSLEEPEADRSWAALEVTWDDVNYGYTAEYEDVFLGTLDGQRLELSGCSFGVAPSVEPTDSLFGVRTEPSEGTNNVLLLSSPRGLDVLTAPFAEPCVGCSFSP